MEDYNEVPFRQMVGAKIEKKDSERGVIEGMGFPIHGGKPIKELYRTVYTGGPGCPGGDYMKNPVMDPKVVQTNDEGATEKTLKSDRILIDEKGNPQAIVENDNKDEETEHEEKSVCDMIADRNITGFAKRGGTEMGRERFKVAADLDDIDAAEDAYGQMLGDPKGDNIGVLIDEDANEVYGFDAIHRGNMGKESDRITPAEHSEPRGHNAVGMAAVRNKMAHGADYPKIIDPTLATLSGDKRIEQELADRFDTMAQSKTDMLGDEGYDDVLVMGDDGPEYHETVNKNPHQGEEARRQRLIPSL